MYAVVETGGKQVKVQVGDMIFVEKLPNNVGEEVILDKVLLVSGDKLMTGKPFVKGAKVKAKVEKQGKEKKIVVYKYKAKTNERKKQGHRQPYTCLLIEAIEA